MLSAEGTSSTQCAWPAPSLVPTSGQSQNTSNYCHMSFHTLHHAPSHTIYCAPARTRYPKMASECILNHVKTTVHHIMLVEGNSLISCKGKDLPCTYLAHRELASVTVITIISGQISRNLC